MRSFLVNAGVFIVSVLVALLLAEAGLRVTGFQPGNPFGRIINHRDDVLGYRMVPGTREAVPGPGGVYQVNIIPLAPGDEVGFRDDGVDPPVDSVFIGDSFVWGYGVELADSISEQFERLTGSDAVNLAMTSWTSPTQYARLVDHHAAPLRPRRVFIGLFLGNDFGDGVNFADWEASGSSKSYPEWLTDLTRGYVAGTVGYRVRRWLYDHSALGRFVSDRIEFGLAQPPSGTVEKIPVHGNGLAMNLYPAELSDRAPTEREVAILRDALRAIAATGRRAGFEPVVFIIPVREMVYQAFFPDPELQARADARYTALLALLAELPLRYVDLLPGLRAATGGPQLYFSDDGHWTPAGHALAARILAGAVSPQQAER